MLPIEALKDDIVRAMQAEGRLVLEAPPGAGKTTRVPRHLLDAGLAAQGEIIVTTDDDVRVEPDWLNTIERGLDAQQCDYVGGRVLPLWEGATPRWLPKKTITPSGFST